MSEVKMKKGKLSYKYTVSLSLLCLAAIFLGIFCWYSYYNYQVETRENARREAEYSANRLVSQLDERFSTLYQYYTSSMLEDDMKWMMENDVKYSDYSHYSEASEIMASKKIFGDYIKGYALINFRSDIVLSNKGMFPLEEAYNKELLYAIYEESKSSIDKSFWYYKDGEDLFKPDIQEVDKNDYRTVEIEGLNLVMKLPLDSRNQNSMLIVNIDMSSWTKWLDQWMNDYEDVLVLDYDGNFVYSSNALLYEKYVNEEFDKIVNTKKSADINDKTYMIAKQTADVLGWQYCVFYNVEEGQKTETNLSNMMLLLLVAFLSLCVYVISYVIYRPVKLLMSGLADKEQKIEGNELDYFANSFANLKNDKQSLEHVVVQQQDKLQELFELRLIRGEVRTSEELEEYLQNLHLNQYKYFATAVMVLNLRGEQETQSNINEDAICLNLVETLPEQIKQYTWMPLVYNACTLFCVFGDNDENQLLNKVNGFYKELQIYAENASGYRVLMGVSATHTDYHHMRAAYRESVNALTMQSVEADSDCHFYLSTTTMAGSSYNNSFEKDIQNALKALDKEQCYKVTDEFSVYLQQCENHDEAMIYILRYLNTILLTALDAKVDLNTLYPDGLKKVYREIIEVIEPSRVRRYLKRVLIDEIIQARSQLLENSSYSMMEEIERKIVESKGNITLAECAEALGVHTTYIWKILKMEKGKSFSDYLEEYKLDEAKRLLLQTNLSVAEIATELNYTNAQNFIRFFSKGTGVTPGKFRKLY